jgi:hypothetical protein
MKHSVTAVIRKDQTNQQGECPLYVRYTFNRKSINFPLGESILLSSWDLKNDMPKTSYKQFRTLYETINNLIDKINGKVLEFNVEKPLMLTTQKRIKVTTRKRSILTTRKRIILTT